MTNCKFFLGGAKNMEKIWQFFKKIFSTQPQNTDKRTEIRIINIIHNEKIKSEPRGHPLKVKNSK